MKVFDSQWQHEQSPPLLVLLLVLFGPLVIALCYMVLKRPLLNYAVGSTGMRQAKSDNGHVQ